MAEEKNSHCQQTSRCHEANVLQDLVSHWVNSGKLNHEHTAGVQDAGIIAESSFQRQMARKASIFESVNSEEFHLLQIWLFTPHQEILLMFTAVTPHSNGPDNFTSWRLSSTRAEKSILNRLVASSAKRLVYP